MKLARAFVALLLLCAPAAARAAGAGSNLFGLEISNGTADLYSIFGSGGRITAFEHSEIGVQVQTWHFVTDDYAMTVSAGIGFFKEVDEPAPSLPAPARGIEYTQSSYNVRIGGDRVVKVGERASFYFGPGIEYWSGKAKYTGVNVAGSWEDQNISRYSLSGRLGGIMWVAPNLGFSCQIGRKLGRASATDNGAKATWWPSSFDAAGGLVYDFGGR